MFLLYRKGCSWRIHQNGPAHMKYLRDELTQKFVPVPTENFLYTVFLSCQKLLHVKSTCQFSFLKQNQWQFYVTWACKNNLSWWLNIAFCKTHWKDDRISWKYFYKGFAPRIRPCLQCFKQNKELSEEELQQTALFPIHILFWHLLLPGCAVYLQAIRS